MSDVRWRLWAYSAIVRGRKLLKKGGWAALVETLPPMPAPRPPERQPGREDPSDGEIDRIADICARAARTLPLDSRCLERSYATCVTLRKAGIAATMRIGVSRRPPMLFHAWTQVGDQVINEPRPVQAEYLVVHEV